MEQLAPVINWIKTNRFWIGCFVASVLMIVIYYFAVDSANKVRQQRASEYNGLFKDVANVQATNADGVKEDVAEGGEVVRAHPNQYTQKGMEERIKEAEKAAIEAWVHQYNRQRGLLIFPEAEIKNDDFMAKVKDFIPAEKGKNYPIDTYGELRGIYKDMLNLRMTNLSKIVGTTWMFEEKAEEKSDDEGDGSGLATPEGGGGDAVPDGGDDGSLDLNADIVKWNDKNQKLWRQKITDFRGDPLKNDNVPTTYEILLLQEDLWVFESVLKIIAGVNKGADANDLADVKEIDHILVGREAYLDISKTEIALPNVDPGENELSDELAKSTTKKKDSGFGKIGGAKKRGKGKAGRDGAAKGGAEFDFKVSRDPSHGRYVDNDYYPIIAEDVVKGVLATKLTNYASLTVAKRIPVRVGVVMNEKQIGEFLAACANAELPFEVRQVRINRHTPGDGEYIKGNANGGAGGSARGKKGKKGMSAPQAGGGMNAPQAGGGAGAAVGGDFSGTGGGGRDMGSRGGGSSGSADTRTNYDVSVEFYGIIKIYNPVKYNLLGGSDPNAAAKKADGKKGEKKAPVENKAPKAKP